MKVAEASLPNDFVHWCLKDKLSIPDDLPKSLEDGSLPPSCHHAAWKSLCMAGDCCESKDNVLGIVTLDRDFPFYAVNRCMGTAAVCTGDQGQHLSIVSCS